MPYRSGRAAPRVASSTKPSPKAYLPGVDSGTTSTSSTDIATTTTEPPTQIGVPAQYNNEVTAPACVPKAARTQA